MAAKLFDRASGKWVDVNDADVDPLVKSGSHAFESGIDVPVVSPDGELGSLPASEAEAAFRDGYRWATPKDSQAFEARGKEQINEEVYGGQPEAAAARRFVSEGSFGATDVILPAIAGAVYGDQAGAGVKEGLKQTKERNVIPSLIGGTVGALTGGPEMAIKAAKEVGSVVREAGQFGKLYKAGELGEGALATSGAARLAGAVGREAGIGAVYGLGEGVSEAALGDPQDVAENLASSIGMGALFGGAFGSAFQGFREVAPYGKALISKVGQGVEDAFQLAQRKGVKKGLEAVLSLKDNDELKKFAGDLADQPEIREAMFSGGIEKVKALKAEIDSGSKILASEMADNQRALERFIEKEPKEIRNRIQNEILPQAHGDIQTGLENVANQVAGEQAMIQAKVSEAGRLQSFMPDLYGSTNILIKDLERIGDSKAKSLAKNLDMTLKAEMSSRGVSPLRDPEGLAAMSAHDEYTIATDLRQQVQTALSGASREKVVARLQKYADDIAGHMHSNELYGVEQRKLDQLNTSYDKLRGFLTGAAKNKTNTEIKQTVLNKLLTDPRKAKSYNALFSNVSEIVPEMEAFRKAGKDAIKQQTAIEALQNKIKVLQNGAPDGLSTDDYKEILTSLKAPANLMDQLERFKSLQESFQSMADASPATKYMAIQKALGNPIKQEAAQLLKHGEWFEKLQKHFGKEYDKSLTDKMIALVTKRAARTAVGGLVGGYIGDTTGAIAGASLAGMVSPYVVLKNLTKLESMQSAAQQRSVKAVHAAIDALTSTTGKRFVTAATSISAADSKASSIAERRKTFKARAAYLTQLSDPNTLATEVENRMGDMQYTPQIGAAMSAQFARTAQFLQEKLPMDPLMGKSPFFESKWQPSDHQLAQFERYVNAAENPVRSIENIAKGRISPEEVETLKTIYPKLYGQLQQGVLTAIMDRKSDLAYSQRLRLSTLFDAPVDATLSGTFIGTMQSQYEEGAKGPMNGAPQQAPPGKPIHININPQATATETSQITNKNSFR